MNELYLCTRYHETNTSTGAVAIILPKQDALEWFNNENKNLLDWDIEYKKYTNFSKNFFSYDDNDGSTLTVQISLAIAQTIHTII